MKSSTEDPKTIGQTHINRLLRMWQSVFLTYPESLSDWLDRMDRAFPEWNIKPNKTNLINYISGILETNN